MKIKVSYKERFYFIIMILISLAAYTFLFRTLFKMPSILSKHYSLFLYPVLFLVFEIFVFILFIGYIKGNAIKVGHKQFSDVFEILKKHSQALGLKKVPDMYILQGNGVLNAFATRFSGKNFVVLYSNIFEIAYEEGKDAISFIIGHELGHIKRNHVSIVKSIFLLPAKLIPFLNFAYSRACEYTCDMIGYNLSAKGAINGILILAVGKKLYKNINVSELINNVPDEPGFAFWAAEIFSTHPHAVNRIAELNELNDNNLDLENFDFINSKTKIKNIEIQQ